MGRQRLPTPTVLAALLKPQQPVLLLPAPHDHDGFAGEVGSRQFSVHVSAGFVVDVGPALLDGTAGVGLTFGEARFSESINER